MIKVKEHKMKRYILNGSYDVVYEAPHKEAATLMYIEKFCGAATMTDYINHCVDIGMQIKIEWTELPPIGWDKVDV